MDGEAVIHIRKAVIDDFIAIHLLNMFSLGYDYPPEKTKKRIAVILLNRSATLLVAEADGEVVGYIHAVDYDCTYSDSLKSILAIAVDEEWRGKGIGRALLNAVEKWSKSNGSSGVRLVTSSYREGAHKFYKSCGYTLRKEQSNFIKLF